MENFGFKIYENDLKAFGKHKSELLLYSFLVDYCHDKNGKHRKAFFSNAFYKDRLFGYSNRTVQKAFKNLEKWGYISIDRGFDQEKFIDKFSRTRIVTVEKFPDLTDNYIYVESRWWMELGLSKNQALIYGLMITACKQNKTLLMDKDYSCVTEALNVSLNAVFVAVRLFKQLGIVEDLGKELKLNEISLEQNHTDKLEEDIILNIALMKREELQDYPTERSNNTEKTKSIYMAWVFFDWVRDRLGYAFVKWLSRLRGWFGRQIRTAVSNLKAKERTWLTSWNC